MSLSSTRNLPNRRDATSIGKFLLEAISLEQTARAFAGNSMSGERALRSLSSTLNLPDRRHATSIGKLRVEAISLEQTARAFVIYCMSRERRVADRPFYSTSVNGQVISLCANNPDVAELFREADSINADGQPMVTVSRYLARTPLPERVATTDLFPAVAKLAAKAGLTFYILGASERVNAKAVEEIRNGYFARDDEDALCAEIASLQPDILWISLGCPLEQQFVHRNLRKLAGVGIIKTAGGLLDFLSLEKPRAPSWMQRLGFEWLFRTMLEPKRLLMRYVTTNPHALYVLLTSMR